MLYIALFLVTTMKEQNKERRKPSRRENILWGRVLGVTYTTFSIMVPYKEDEFQQGGFLKFEGLIDLPIGGVISFKSDYEAIPSGNYVVSCRNGSNPRHIVNLSGGDPAKFSRDYWLFFKQDNGSERERR